MEFNLKIAIDDEVYYNQHIDYRLVDSVKNIIATLEVEEDWGTVKDVNGNTVGSWILE
jgi:hypothetical protein